MDENNALESALKNATGDIRVTYGWRWLVWSEGEWKVMEHKPYQRGTSVVAGCSDLQTAVEALTSDTYSV